MNKIEKVVYDLVKSNPQLKLFLRNTYQSVFDLLPEKIIGRRMRLLKKGILFWLS